MGNFNEKAGGGSLSLMLLVDRPMANEGGEDSYKLDDFDESIYGGKTIQRVQLMLDRGITITDEVNAEVIQCRFLSSVLDKCTAD